MCILKCINVPSSNCHYRTIKWDLMHSFLQKCVLTFTPMLMITMRPVAFTLRLAMYSKARVRTWYVTSIPKISRFTVLNRKTNTCTCASNNCSILLADLSLFYIHSRRNSFQIYTFSHVYGIYISQLIRYARLFFDIQSVFNSR
jgi:hypothetical protein